MNMSNFFPVTVIAAIFLFLLKEILEVSKKRRERVRKISAMKNLIAEEIELNHWVWKSLSSLFDEVSQELEEDEDTKYFVKKKGSAERFECLRSDNSFWGQGFPGLKDERYQKLAVDIATVDAEFFKLASACYSAIAELRHLRNGVYSYLDEDGDEKDFRGGFISYARDQMPNIYSAMNNLYVFCVGVKLESHRMR